ncbi:hypothetical protein BHM03_00034276 [Ensete ventricosum]|nr:hypothetical protein BHM03_00034276 [Ensete ventricosum]
MRVSPTPSRRQSFLCRYSQPLLFESLPGEAFILVCRQSIVPFLSVFTAFSVGVFNAAGTADGSLHSGWACRVWFQPYCRTIFSDPQDLMEIVRHPMTLCIGLLPPLWRIVRRCIFVMFVVIYCWSGWLRFLMYPLGHLSSYDLNRTAPNLPQSRGSSSPLLSLLASGHSPSIRILSFPQTLASACTGDPTMALSIGFLPAFTIGDGASGAALPRRAVLLPSFAPPRRWAVAAAVEAAPDATGKRRPRGITKPRPVSPELQAVVGEAEIPRTQALKKIWAYIKENNLQVLFFILHL